MARRNRTRDSSTDPKYWSTPMMKGRLQELLTELGVGPSGKRATLTDMVSWVVHELAPTNPADPRAVEAIRIATIWWEHERSSK